MIEHTEKHPDQAEKDLIGTSGVFLINVSPIADRLDILDERLELQPKSCVHDQVTEVVRLLCECDFVRSLRGSDLSINDCAATLHHSKLQGVLQAEQSHERDAMGGPARHVGDEICDNEDKLETIQGYRRLSSVEDLADFPMIIDPPDESGSGLRGVGRELVDFEVITKDQLELAAR